MGGFITGGMLAIRGGASVAFKQAMIGGVILVFIEVVQQVWMAMSIRNQHLMMQEMQRQALERQKMMMSRGGENAWDVGYSKEMD
jgi:hypothetical protein